MDAGELALAFGLEGANLEAIFEKIEIPLHHVAPEDANLPIGVLAGLDEGGAEASASLPAESVLVFCGLSGLRLREVLARLREAGAAAHVLKAVLTAHNRAWPLHALVKELARDREAIQQARKQ